MLSAKRASNMALLKKSDQEKNYSTHAKKEQEVMRDCFPWCDSADCATNHEGEREDLVVLTILGQARNHHHPQKTTTALWHAPDRFPSTGRLDSWGGQINCRPAQLANAAQLEIRGAQRQKLRRLESGATPTLTWLEASRYSPVRRTRSCKER